MTIGGIQAFVSYVVFMIWPIQEMARVYAELQHAVASAERIFSLMVEGLGREFMEKTLNFLQRRPA